VAGRVITVTSGKGGVGKTTFSANVSAALAELGKKAVAVDTDVGLRNLDIVMGLENRIVFDLVDVVEGRCRLQKAIIRDKRIATLHMLPAAQTRDKSAVSPDAMEKICAELRSQFDFTIIDSPAGIEGGFQNAIAGADEVVIVTTPHVSAIRDADLGLNPATQGNLIRDFQQYYDLIGYIQTGDVPGRKEPGTGEVNYRNVFKAIYEKGYRGIIGMEHGWSEKGMEGFLKCAEAYRQADAFS